MGLLRSSHIVLRRTSRVQPIMRSAVAVLFLVTAIAAEAPYHLPRPAPQAPTFNYPIQHAPALLRYSTQQNIPSPQPSFQQNSGYQYQQSSIASAFLQPISQSQIQQQPQLQPQLQPQPLPMYDLSEFQIAPRPQTLVEPIRPHPTYLPPQSQLKTVRPLPSYITPQPNLEPIRTLPAFIAPQPQPSQIQPSTIYRPIAYYQPQQLEVQQEYSYQQPQARPFKYTSQLPLISQPINTNAGSQSLSSYQADTNLYRSVQPQTHGEGLDATVVDRVQNIIKENEHDSARNAGYLSLVSGVSLEGAKPSIEISSFIQNSPLSTSQSSELNSLTEKSSDQSSLATASVSTPSSGYGLPTIASNNQPSDIDSRIAFLPQSKPASSYGTPN